MQIKFSKIMKLPWHDRMNKASGLIARAKTASYYRLVFGGIGRSCVIYRPDLISNPRFIHIGNDTVIRSGARLEAIVVDESNPPRLTIGNDVNIEQNVHIVCSSSLKIEDHVSITGNCAVVDTSHPYFDALDTRKIGDRLNSVPSPVSIGAYSFLGFGCIVLPGVTIGKYCIIGANSTVTHDIPDYSVAAGSPARVIKRYDSATNTWRSQTG